jgi:N-acetylglucosaminyl-diphospho-decaprenol L-rhamnosyltransferase
VFGAAVIVVTHNSGGVIEDWLESLEPFSAREQLELCVVDCGSSPDQVELLRERVAPRVHHLVLERNVGFGAGCNAGAAATAAPVLVFLNPDARLDRLPAGLLDPARVGGTIHGSAVRSQAGGPTRPSGFSALPSARHEAASLVFGRLSRTYQRAWTSPAWVSGGSMVLARRDFEAVGGFDPSIFLFFEDADLCARHRRRGGDVVVDPRFEVIHRGGAGSGDAPDSPSLDAVARQSARLFISRWSGHPVRAVLLYLVLATFYVPRRMAVEMARGRGPVIPMALDLLFPSRVRRRLGASPRPAVRPLS